jgi:hypothetical protein
MPDDPKKTPPVVRSPEPRVEAGRGAEERRRASEISREIEELGRVLESHDRLAGHTSAPRAEPPPAQATQPGGRVGVRSAPKPDPALEDERPAVTSRCSPYARAMIKAWQKEQGLPETGFLDESQLVALLEQVTPTKPAEEETKLVARRQA